MVKVKSREQIKANYEGAAGEAAKRYKQGIKGADWQGPAKEGQELYVERMTDPDVLERREKGIDRVSNSEWEKAADTKGSGVIGGRMRAAADKQATRFQPYKEALEGVTLEKKTADGETNVINRVVPIVKAMEAKKKEIG